MNEEVIVAAIAFTLAFSAHAQTADPAAPAAAPTYAELVAMKVPVTAGDIADRPYRVIGDVEAGVRKATIFSKSASPAKVYRELWERGRKLGADAVIHARFGESHVTLMSSGRARSKGRRSTNLR